MACKLYSVKDLDPNTGEPLPNTGVALDDIEGIKKFAYENNIDLDELLSDIGGEPPSGGDMQGESGGEKGKKAVVERALLNSDKLTPETKQRIEDNGIEYTILSNEEAFRATDEIVEALGGIEKAYKVALENNDLPAYIRTMIRGGAMQHYGDLARNAETDQERQLWAEKEANAIIELDEYARDLGRGVQIIAALYRQSEWGLKRAYEKQIDDYNEKRQVKAKKVAKEVNKIVKDNSGNKGALNSATNDILGENKSKEIQDLKNEISKLKEKLKGKPKGSKGNPIDIFNSRAKKAKGELAAAYERLSKPKTAALLPSELQDLAMVIGDQFEAGLTKAQDIFDALYEKVNPKYVEGFEQAYKMAKEEASAKTLFTNLDTDEAIADAAENTAIKLAEDLVKLNQQLDAKKAEELIAKTEKQRYADKKTEITEAFKEREAEIKRGARENQDKVPQFDVAERIKSDIEAINFPKTKKAQGVLAELAKQLSIKAKDFYKSKDKATPKSGAEWLKYASQNMADAKRIWENSISYVDSVIDNDKSLFPYEKAALKAFLYNYYNSTFDSVLNNNKATKIVKEALKDKGFIDDKGNVNWKSLVADDVSAEQAKQELSNWIKENTGLTDAEASPLINQITKRFENEVEDRKAREIARIVTGSASKSVTRRVKPQLQRLQRLNDVGGLTSESAVKALASEFGLVSMNEAQQAEFGKLIKDYANSPMGALKAKAGEDLEYFIFKTIYGYRGGGLVDYLAGELTLSLNDLPTRYTSRLYGYMTLLKNTSAAIDVLGKTIMNMVKDPKAGKIAIKELPYAWNSFKSILLDGDVGLSQSILEDLEQTGRKYAVRTLETQNPKFLGLLPDAYIKAGSKMYNANVLNQALRAEKFIYRFAEATDSLLYAPLQAQEEYSYLKHKIRQTNPALTKRQAAQLAYETVYSKTIKEAQEIANKDFQKLGKTPTRAQYNRRVGEIIAQQRGTDVRETAKKLTDEVLFKNSEYTGLISGVGHMALIMKRSLSNLILSRNAKDPSRARVIANSIAKLSTNTILPFITGASNILERAAEFNPYYGGAKSLVYGARSLAIDGELNPEKKYLYTQRTYNYATRAIIGILFVSLAKALIQWSKEEGNEDSYLSGGMEGSPEELSVGTGNKKPSTLRIFGTNIPLDNLGTVGMLLKTEGDYLDLLNKKGVDDNTWLQDPKYSLANAPNIFNVSFLQGLQTVGDVGKDIVNANFTRRTNRLTGNIAANLLTPMAGVSRQSQTMVVDGKQVDARTFPEYFYKATGLPLAWKNERYAKTATGSEFYTSDKYSGVASLNVGNISKSENASTIDELSKEMLKKGVQYKNVKTTEQGTPDTFEYSIVGDDGKLRFMTFDETIKFEKYFQEYSDEYLAKNYQDNQEFFKNGDKKQIQSFLNTIRENAINEALLKINEDVNSDVPDDIKAYKEMREKSKEMSNKKSEIKTPKFKK